MKIRLTKDSVVGIEGQEFEAVLSPVDCWSHGQGYHVDDEFGGKRVVFFTESEVVEEINPVLIEAANSKGFVVRQQHDWTDNKFGKTHIITLENGDNRITFVSNVLNGVNYFQIQQVYNVHTGKTYKAWRYFHKFISLISSINGDVYIKLNGGQN